MKNISNQLIQDQHQILLGAGDRLRIAIEYTILSLQRETYINNRMQSFCNSSKLRRYSQAHHFKARSVEFGGRVTLEKHLTVEQLRYSPTTHTDGTIGDEHSATDVLSDIKLTGYFLV